MDNPTLIILIVAVVAIAVGGFWYYLKRRTEQLKGRFGPEYQRALNEFGDRGKAESELERRVKRSNRFAIHDLSPEESNRFAERWRSEQARFVDEPSKAVMQAHGLVNEVMKARGYPVSTEFERNAEDLSADHPVVVQHYRQACDIVARQEHGQVTTEDLRKAMVHYRALFEELLGVRVNQTEEVRR
jgi:FtsZ-interacting cell division protein ZipA